MGSKQNWDKVRTDTLVSRHGALSTAIEIDSAASPQLEKQVGKVDRHSNTYAFGHIENRVKAPVKFIPAGPALMLPKTGVKRVLVSREQAIAALKIRAEAVAAAPKGQGPLVSYKMPDGSFRKVPQRPHPELVLAADGSPLCSCGCGQELSLEQLIKGSFYASKKHRKRVTVAWVSQHESTTGEDFSVVATAEAFTDIL